MKTIVDINQLSLPDIYKETLLFMVSKLQEFSIINDIILFGSCARQDVSNYSDIGLALVVSEPMSPEEEWNIDFSIRKWDANLPCDVIFIPKDAFECDIKGDTIIRPILQEGVSLNGLLR